MTDVVPVVEVLSNGDSRKAQAGDTLVGEDGNPLGGWELIDGLYQASGASLTIVVPANSPMKRLMPLIARRLD